MQNAVELVPPLTLEEPRFCKQAHFVRSPRGRGTSALCAKQTYAMSAEPPLRVDSTHLSEQRLARTFD